jgi:chemosensory pili system protein ChpE
MPSDPVLTPVLSIAVAGLAAGFLFNATPGAVFAETLRRGLRGGYWPAFDVQIGSLVGDATWAIAGLSAAGALLSIPAVRAPLAFAGALYLLWLGWQGLREALRAGAAPAAAASGAAIGAEPVHRAGAVRAGVLLSVTNPQNLGFWAAVGAVVPALGDPAPARADLAWFFAGFMTSSVLWCFICAGLVAWLRHALPDAIVRTLHFTCGAFLVGLALLQFWRLLEERHAPRAAAVEFVSFHSRP